MTKNITTFLLENFPDRSELSHEDFTKAGEDEPRCMNDAIECCAYDYDTELAERAFRNISRPWPEIDWSEIGNYGSMVPLFLNKKSFIHAFPSLLNYLHIYDHDPEEGVDLLIDTFIRQLDLNYLRHIEKEITGEGTENWRRNFYFSLSEEIKRVICKLLTPEEEGSMGCEDVLESYWGLFAEDAPGLAEIMKMLEAHFPSMESLPYDELVDDEIKRLWKWDEGIIHKFHESISRPWPEISWPEIEALGKQQGIDACAITSFLNKRSFIHVFPSLLSAIIKREANSLTDHFIKFHLNLNKVSKDWELEFYFSLDEDVVKLVNLVLKLVCANEAIDSYWH